MSAERAAALRALAERVEKEGGSNALDWAIADLLGEVPKHKIQPVGFDYDWHRNSEADHWLRKATDSEGRSMQSWSPGRRTSSVDAALTLIPAGCFHISGAGRVTLGEPLYGAQIMKPDEPNSAGLIVTDVIGEGEHPTSQASAIVAAALRALAAEAEAAGGGM